MNAFWADLLLRVIFVTWKGVKPILLAKVKELVQLYGTRSDLTGPEKLAALKQDLYDSRGDLKMALLSIGPGLLNMLIENVKERYFPSKPAV